MKMLNSIIVRHAQEVMYNFRHKRKKFKKIVFTNGCFDILHPGHFDLLETAANMGEYFIVGLNTDRSFKELKGKNPIFTLDERAYMLSRIGGIDLIITYDNEEELAEIILNLDPDYVVKEISTLPRESGSQSLDRGTMVYVPAKYKYSTSKVIEKINGNL